MDFSERGRELEGEWNARLAAYADEYPEEAAALELAAAGVPPEGWDKEIPSFAPEDGPIATRAASGLVLNGLADRIPWLIGGSADLAGSTKTIIASSGSLSAESPEERNLHWGVREHGMAGASNGMALHGGVRPYAATFFVFTDYARPAIRLAAMMGLPVIYVMTHDSIGLGEDGPTHQPIEHLASLRAMPGLQLIRPADATEVACAWRAAIEHLDGPDDAGPVAPEASDPRPFGARRCGRPQKGSLRPQARDGRAARHHADRDWIRGASRPGGG